MQLVEQDPEQVLEQVPVQSAHDFLQDCNVEGATVAKTAIPKIGKLFFAASLKNSLLFLSSFCIV